MNEKDTEETKEQQIQKKIVQLEVKCHESIKDHEKQAALEQNSRLDNERAIQQQRATPNPEDLFTKILEKSIYEKARDKMKMGKKKDEDETEKEKVRDYLLPILKKLSLENAAVFEEEAAISVKNEALRSLKERLLTRAEIIQRRLNDESEKLSQAYVSYLFHFVTLRRYFIQRNTLHLHDIKRHSFLKHVWR